VLCTSVAAMTSLVGLKYTENGSDQSQTSGKTIEPLW